MTNYNVIWFSGYREQVNSTYRGINIVFCRMVVLKGRNRCQDSRIVIANDKAIQY